jgi:hypothetical protein
MIAGPKLLCYVLSISGILEACRVQKTASP